MRETERGSEREREIKRQGGKETDIVEKILKMVHRKEK